MATNTPHAPTVLGIDEMRALFRARAPWVLWLGSAVSVEHPSAIPGVPALVGALLEVLGRGDETGDRAARGVQQRAQRDLSTDGRNDLLRSGVPFEVILGEIANHSDGFVPAFLERLVPRGAGAVPNPNHLAVAALLGRRVDLVVTTNFDECLEATGVPFSRVVPAIGGFSVPKSPGLLKLHGTISQADSVAVNPRTLADRARPRWQRSLADCLAGRSVLFVGYSFSDRFDINPALRMAAREGARFVWACRPSDLDGSPHTIPIGAVVFHDLADPDRNILRVLGGDLRRSTPARPSGMSRPEQSAVARAAAEGTETAMTLPLAVKLAALGALYFWVERGEDALRCFTTSARCPGSRVDHHILARACLRARRYGAAVRWFDQMLENELPADGPERVVCEIDWSIGAGHCAAAGGRPGLAGRYYRRAVQAFNSAGMRPADLDPYLADQLLRSQAAHETARAKWGPKQARDVHLARARQYLSLLLERGDLALPTRPLVLLGLAEVELVAGNGDRARHLIEQASELVDGLGDPHLTSVCERKRAVARRDRRAQARLAAVARSNGRWMEWAKIQLERRGFDEYGSGGRIERALRDLMISSWDRAKELLRPIR